MASSVYEEKARLEKRVKELKAENDRLKKQVADLRKQVNQIGLPWRG